MATRTPKGKDAFLEYYRSVFGDETDAVLNGLLQPIPPILRFSAQRAEALKTLWQKEGLSFETLPWYPLATLWPKELPFGETLPGYTEELFYPMSPSSLLPVLALEVEHGDLVLDACAAPGGKALLIAESLHGTGELVANDLSASRVQRLKKVLTDWPVTITAKPAEVLPYSYPTYFDKILVDAPCSSEQHVYQSPTHLATWSHKRITTLKKRQYGLVKSLLYALKPGGKLVYSTCAITPEENEEVIAKVLKKNPDLVELAAPLKRIMPHTDGMDPMFVAVLTKR